MSEKVIVQFTIDPEASHVVRKELKAKLQHVHGKCKSCGWNSRVHYGWIWENKFDVFRDSHDV